MINYDIPLQNSETSLNDDLFLPCLDNKEIEGVENDNN